MSSAVSTSAAYGRPFLFDAEPHPKVGSDVGTAALGCPVERNSTGLRCLVESAIKKQQSRILPSGVTPASRLEVRPSPEMASSGIAELDALVGGFPRGCLTEICGPVSSGRTTVLLAALAAASRRGEYCAIIDANDALDPHSLVAAGVDLDHLLWVRCGEDLPRRHRDTERKKSRESKGSLLATHFAASVGIPRETQLDFFSNKSRSFEHCLEQVLRATDLLLESGGFGLIILDLADVPPQSARRIPLTTWFRFRRAVEHKPTILLAIEQQPIAGSCSSLLLQLGVLSTQYSVPNSLQSNTADAEQDANGDLRPAHAQLFTGLAINVELIRSRLDRKPSHSVTFETKTVWAA
jgi:recA bacterial DNA recombination protein